MSLNTVSVAGAANYNAAGPGRIAVYYQNNNGFSGSFTPGYLQKGSLADSLFQDDFETGDLTKWSSSSVTDGGNISVSTALTYGDQDGLQVVINNTNAKYVQDDSPSDETQYNARFYLNPLGMTMGATDTLDVFDGYHNGSVVLKLQLQQPTSGTYKLRAGAKKIDGTWIYTGWYALTPEVVQVGWNAVEVDFQTVATNETALTLWLNGEAQESLSNTNTDTQRITEVRLGAQGIAITTQGTLYIDQFESRRFSSIGTLLSPDMPQAQPAAVAGWVGQNYTYDPNHPHAVSALTSDLNQSSLGSYVYDANGNMTCRVENGTTYKQDYNVENRISAIHKMNGDCATGTALESWSFGYDGDGTRVDTGHFTGSNPTPDSLTAYYMGGAYEVTGSQAKTYYSIAGMTIAVKSGTDLQYLLTDHLGSVVATTDDTGTLKSKQRYLPFGGIRTDVISTFASPTDFGYTSQRKLADGMGGIMDYKARFYSPYINRFLQPDTLIPDQSNPQSWNRYSYVSNNPVNYNDPTGHMQVDDDDTCYACTPNQKESDLAEELRNFKELDTYSAEHMIPKSFLGHHADLTPDENLALQNYGPYYDVTFISTGLIAEYATGRARDLFPDQPNDHSPRNAFQHAFWNALMTASLGEDFAADFATGHEKGTGSEREDQFMDLHNNEVGRQISLDNPNASAYVLATKVLEAMQAGELYVWDQKNIYFSDRCPLCTDIPLPIPSNQWRTR